MTSYLHVQKNDYLKVWHQNSAISQIVLTTNRDGKCIIIGNMQSDSKSGAAICINIVFMFSSGWNYHDIGCKQSDDCQKRSDDNEPIKDW